MPHLQLYDHTVSQSLDTYRCITIVGPQTRYTKHTAGGVKSLLQLKLRYIVYHWNACLPFPSRLEATPRGHEVNPILKGDFGNI